VDRTQRVPPLHGPYWAAFLTAKYREECQPYSEAAATDPNDITILENKVFLNSLRQAISDPVGMPAAMLAGLFTHSGVSLDLAA
jgi:hypothetical protein